MATAFNVWTPLGNVIPNTAVSGASILANPSVIYDNNSIVLFPGSPSTFVFKMWLQATIGSNYGLYYFESADGETSWTPYTSNPLSPFGSVGIFIVPTIYKIGNTYYIYTSQGGTISVYTSPDGVTLTLANSSAIAPSGSGWDATAVYQPQVVDVIEGTWYVYYSGTNGTTYGQGLATSTDGTHFTKSLSNPIFPGPIGNSSFLKISSSSYYMYAHGQYLNAQLASNNFDPLFRYSATSPSGPWTQLQYNSAPVATYYPAIAADFTNGSGNQIQSNINDQRMCVALGNVYLYFTKTVGGGGQVQINAAVALGITPAQLVGTYEGAVNAPISGNTSLNLIILASDPGTGANSNPLGGNWTPAGSSGAFGPAQRLSNVITPASISTPQASSFWNALTWANDQWAQVTVSQIAANSSVGVALRMSTTGPANLYGFYWTGTLGNSGTWNINKRVGGTGTLLVSDTGLIVNAGDTIMGVAIGTSLMWYWNGFLIAQIADSSLVSGSAGFFLSAQTSVSNAAISAWSGGTFQNAPPINPTGTGTGSLMMMGCGQ